MKILDAYHFDVEARNVNDQAQNQHLEYILGLVVGCKDLGAIDASTTIYVPYDLWVVHGGKGCITPYGVQLVHGLDEVCTSLEGKHIPRRNFLVPDQASPTGQIVRKHFCSYAINPSGMMTKINDRPYCGQRGKGEEVTYVLDEVTCPECLMELKQVNQSH
ncbi:hypothetical protein vBVpaS1601_54 [Vibrio phage vB_VpaS_1601]|uniref:hypothetical protein n=1 Tax=Vibrio phage SHOU24 TaxID=1414739 RepID=UPI0003ED228E|nr:hypothetical protein SHOU24_28 [Vibrio phage SHOU24]AHI61225.1 hypothetical protein SHOU24_28 [Vibrio phage SHOU24]WHM52747.1 hypothetical protein vBVpaP1601_54 [Vibrio phage vB_VpaP_1601]